MLRHSVAHSSIKNKAFGAIGLKLPIHRYLVLVMHSVETYQTLQAKLERWVRGGSGDSFLIPGRSSCGRTSLPHWAETSDIRGQSRLSIGHKTRRRAGVISWRLGVAESTWRTAVHFVTPCLGMANPDHYCAAQWNAVYACGFDEIANRVLARNGPT